MSIDATDEKTNILKEENIERVTDKCVVSEPPEEFGCTLDILIPSAFQDTLTDEVLKNIAAETKSHIHLDYDKNDCMMLLLSITGVVSSKADACKAIFDLLCETESAFGEAPMLKIKLNELHFGDIVGFNGHSLNKIGNNTSTHLSLCDEVVVIEGTSENICKAQKCITSIVDRAISSGEEYFNKNTRLSACKDAIIEKKSANDRHKTKRVNEENLPITHETSKMPRLNSETSELQVQDPSSISGQDNCLFSDLEERIKQFIDLINSEGKVPPGSWTIENIKYIISGDEKCQQLREKLAIAERDKADAEERLKEMKSSTFKKSESMRKMREEIITLQSQLRGNQRNRY